MRLQRQRQHRISCSILLCMLLHISLACIDQVAAVKRTMPMIGMDEEEEGEEQKEAEVTYSFPRSSGSWRSAINSFLGGAVTVSAPFQAMSPVEREYQRQLAFPSGEVMGDLNGGDDNEEGKNKNARIPNVLGSGRGTGVMSYHGGKIVSTPLKVFFIM